MLIKTNLTQHKRVKINKKKIKICKETAQLKRKFNKFCVNWKPNLKNLNYNLT